MSFTFFSTNCSNIETESIQTIQKGFIYFDKNSPFDEGTKIIVRAISKGPSLFEVECFIWDRDETGAKGGEVRCGYLTQEGFNMLRCHDHADCETLMELRC